MSATAAEPSKPDSGAIANEAYHEATGGRITEARDWQASVYDRLSDPEHDAGFLLLAPSASGKTEAVLVPSLGLKRLGGPRHVFIIGADGSPLDDIVLRVTPHLKSWVESDQTSRTIYIDGDDTGPDGNAVRFEPDGTVDTDISISPLEADVDVVVTTFGRFLDLFFGSGGVHGLPSALPLPHETEVRRDLFFFDEAQSYNSVQFSQFLRLVEFLFAEDTDIVVASSTMSPGFEEELSFLEKITVPGDPPPVKLTYRAEADAIAALAAEAAKVDLSNGRTAIVVETAAQADALLSQLSPTLQQSALRYLPGAKPEQRRKDYAVLLAKTEPYLLITTGSYLENSNLDFDTVMSTLCLPESLILRAGRCNRYTRATEGTIVVLGQSLEGTQRVLNKAQQSGYLEALAACDGAAFDPSAWKAFI